MKRKSSKLLGVGLTLALLASLLMIAAPVVAEDPYPDPPAPQMEAIYPLSVVTDDPYNTLTGIVELVFDFANGGAGLTELEIDFGPDPYGGDNREQVGFLAIEPNAGASTEELTLWAEVGIVPSYNASEQKWTITIDTTAVMTAALMELGEYKPFPWAPNEGDPIFPDGLFHWYLKVHSDDNSIFWGSMGVDGEPPIPDYSHYVNYFASESSTVGLGVATPTIVAISVDPTNINFGTVSPGSNSAVEFINVENIGTVTVGVTALIDPAGTVFDNLLLAGGPVGGFNLVSLAGGEISIVTAQLVLPREYSAQGSETATLIFIATATP